MTSLSIAAIPTPSLTSALNKKGQASESSHDDVTRQSVEDVSHYVHQRRTARRRTPNSPVEREYLQFKRDNRGLYVNEKNRVDRGARKAAFVDAHKRKLFHIDLMALFILPATVSLGHLFKPRPVHPFFSR